MKKYILFIFMILSCVTLLACKKKEIIDDKDDKNDKVEEVSNLIIYSNYDISAKKVKYYLTFDKVKDATSYLVKVNTNEIETKRLPLDISEYVNVGRTINASVRSVKELDKDNSIKSEPVYTSFKALQIPNGLIFTELADGTYSVDASKCKNSEITGDITLPDMYDNKKITVIAKESFPRRNMSSGGAMGSNSGTLSFTFPKYIIVVEEYAFNICTKLKKVSFNSCLTEIGYGAFSSCFELEEIEFPDSLEIIDKTAFKGCEALKSIRFNEGLKVIGANSFYSCKSLEEVILSSTITEIGYDAFKNTKWLDYQEGFLYFNDICYASSKNIASVISADMFKKGVKKLSFNFYGSKTIESIEIPNTVISLADNFLQLSSVKEVKFEEGSVLEVLPTQMIAGCKEIETIYIPKSVKTFENNCFNGSALSSIQFEVVPDELGELFTHLVSNTFTVPEGVKIIGEKCFYASSRLTTINLPNSIIEIKQQAFSDCRNLKNINLPSGLKIIGSTEVTEELINGNVIEKINENGAFKNCDSLDTIILPEIETLGWYALSSAKNVLLPKSVKTICYLAIQESANIFYLGSKEDFSKIEWLTINSMNYKEYQNVYYYSENKPTDGGLYWHYVDNVPTIW